MRFTSPASRSTQWGYFATVTEYIVCHEVAGSPSTRFAASSMPVSSLEAYITVRGIRSMRGKAAEHSTAEPSA